MKALANGGDAGTVLGYGGVQGGILGGGIQMLPGAEGMTQKLYSLSAQIKRERKQYYEQLEATQCGTLDVTPWLNWLDDVN